MNGSTPASETPQGQEPDIFSSQNEPDYSRHQGLPAGIRIRSGDSSPKVVRKWWQQSFEVPANPVELAPAPRLPPINASLTAPYRTSYANLNPQEQAKVNSKFSIPKYQATRAHQKYAVYDREEGREMVTYHPRVGGNTFGRPPPYFDLYCYNPQDEVVLMYYQGSGKNDFITSATDYSLRGTPYVCDNSDYLRNKHCHEKLFRSWRTDHGIVIRFRPSKAPGENRSFTTQQLLQTKVVAGGHFYVKNRPCERCQRAHPEYFFRPEGGNKLLYVSAAKNIKDKLAYYKCGKLAGEMQAIVTPLGVALKSYGPMEWPPLGGDNYRPAPETSEPQTLAQVALVPHGVTHGINVLFKLLAQRPDRSLLSTVNGKNFRPNVYAPKCFVDDYLGSKNVFDRLVAGLKLLEHIKSPPLKMSMPDAIGFHYKEEGKDIKEFNSWQHLLRYDSEVNAEREMGYEYHVYTKHDMFYCDRLKDKHKAGVVVHAFDGLDRGPLTLLGGVRRGRKRRK